MTPFSTDPAARHHPAQSSKIGRGSDLRFTDVKITDIRPITTDLSYGYAGEKRASIFILVDTDEGITGVGEATNFPSDGSYVVRDIVVRMRKVLMGQNPFDIDRIWHKLYRCYTYLGSRGAVTTAISGIDIALWDIKGKALGCPVYDLLGGRFRDELDLYANSWFGGCSAPEDFAEAARQTVSEGYTALKFDPFAHGMQQRNTGYLSGQISPAGEELGIAKVAAVRESVGDGVELLVDAHGHYNVPTAIRIGNRLAELDIAWYEEPVPPESLEALRQVRENVGVPISVGERLFTRFDFLPVLQQRLTDYVMPDIVWTGGISELRKISTLAEAYYIPVSPHDAMGPVQLAASAHVMAGVPNFYRLECSVGSLDTYNSVLQEPPSIADGVYRLEDKPGIGVELDRGFVEAHSGA